MIVVFHVLSVTDDAWRFLSAPDARADELIGYAPHGSRPGLGLVGDGSGLTMVVDVTHPVTEPGCPVRVRQTKTLR